MWTLRQISHLRGPNKYAELEVCLSGKPIKEFVIADTSANGLPSAESSSLLSGYQLKVQAHKHAPYTWAMIRNLLWTRNPIVLIEEVSAFFCWGSSSLPSLRDGGCREAARPGDPRSSCWGDVFQLLSPLGTRSVTRHSSLSRKNLLAHRAKAGSHLGGSHSLEGQGCRASGYIHQAPWGLCDLGPPGSSDREGHGL